MNQNFCKVRTERSNIRITVEERFCHDVCESQHPEDYKRCRRPKVSAGNHGS